MEQQIFEALAEPSRFQIIELLRDRPRSVNEISQILQISQPQASKHLQALAKVGLATIYPLGTRRLYSLSPAPLLKVRAWIKLCENYPEHRTQVLEEYLHHITEEQTNISTTPRALTVTHLFSAPRETVWCWWTQPDYVTRWWGPEYFSVTACELDIRSGGMLRIEMQEPDGVRYVTVGTYKDICTPGHQVFTLSPLNAQGTPLFETQIVATFVPVGAQTELIMNVHIPPASTEAAPFIAGIEIGWRQSFSKLDAMLNSSTQGGGP